MVIFTMLVFLLLIKLGFWQISRALEKEQRQQRISELSQQQALSLAQVLTLNNLQDGINDLPIQLDGEFVGDCDGSLDGAFVVGDLLGDLDGWVDGELVVGDPLGLGVGEIEGTLEGNLVGVVDGFAVGDAVVIRLHAVISFWYAHAL